MNKLPSFLDDPMNETIPFPFQEDAQEEFGWKLVHGDIFRLSGIGDTDFDYDFRDFM